MGRPDIMGREILFRNGSPYGLFGFGSKTF